MTFLDNLSPKDILILTNAITVALIEDKTADEMNVIGNFITGIGCLILSLSSQQQYLSVLQQQQQQQNDKSKTSATQANGDNTIIG